VTDTLVLSKLFRPVTPPNGLIAGSKKDPKSSKYADNRIGGHSLEAWGKRMGFPKQDFNDWSHFSNKMLEYCVNDVELGCHIWKYLLKEQSGEVDPYYLSEKTSKPVPFSPLSIKIEHKVAYLLQRQQMNGFLLDVEAAKKLRDDTEGMLNEMNKSIAKYFPPIRKRVCEWSPKLKKDGTLTATSKRILNTKDLSPSVTSLKSSIINPDGSVLIYWSMYDIYETQEFNPRSGQQIADRLLKLGWQPKKFTPTGQPSTDKETLSSAVRELKEEHPEVAFLESYNLVAYNNDKAKKWLEIKQDDNRVYGRINHMGASTHRCTHSDDNMANIASVVLDSDGHPRTGLSGNFGYDCRSCWSVPDGKVLVGADASGIQLRALAHYMNDEAYTKHLLEGDIHTVNQKAAGIKDRPTSKTFIYAWLLGAGDLKTGEIVGVSQDEYNELFAFARDKKLYGSNLLDITVDRLKKNNMAVTKKVVAQSIKGFRTKEKFLNSTPSLKRLRTKEIPEATRRGYLVGLDGRKLWIPSEHLAMSMYLQGFEAVIMKTAINFYHTFLEQKNIPFKQVAFVHDEVQIETLPEHADIVGKTVVDSIKLAGEFFKTKCPLDGEYKVGHNWAETH
jgi:DNA polymerase-1